jgi:hypothetical protein
VDQSEEINWRKRLALQLEFFENSDVYDTATDTVIADPETEYEKLMRMCVVTPEGAAISAAAAAAYEAKDAAKYAEYLDAGGTDDRWLWQFRSSRVANEGYDPPLGYERYVRSIRTDKDEASEPDSISESHSGTSNLDIHGEPVPEPLDIWGESFPAPLLERHMLPEVIADYAWDEAARIGIDPACVAIPALGVCAAGLHDAIRLQPMRNDTQWTERACLWLGFVAPPSARKTPALESARRPAKILEKEWRKADQIAMAKYIHAHDEWKAACRDASKNGEQPPDEPVRPPLRRLSTTDYTMESLADILIDNERGILIFNDELTGFITGLDAYKQTKGKDRSAALELFNGSDRTVDRKGSYQYVPNWSACVAGGIQDDKLRQIAPGLAVDGMLQRFLMFRSNTLKPGEDRVPDMDAIQDYYAMYRTLVGQWDDQPIRLAPDAHKWREEVFQFADALAVDVSLSPAFRTHCGKLRGVFGRLVLTLHAIESSSRAEPIEPVVAENIARMARDLIVEFFIPHELAIYADLFASDHEVGSDMRWIAGHILAHRLDQVRPRDIYRARDEFLRNRKRLFAALRGLEDMGWIEQPDRNGSKWLVNQKIHERYAERGQQERKDREDNRARMIESKKKYAARKQNVGSVG